MSRRDAASRRLRGRRRARRAGLTLAGLAAFAFAIHLLASAATRTAHALASGEVVAQTDDAVPARGPIMFGSSPGEAPAEAWGIGEIGPFGGGSDGIVRYQEGVGWSLSPWLRAAGQPAGEAVLKSVNSPLTGEMTPSGAGALIGTVANAPGEAARETLLVRDPGGNFREVPSVPSEGEEALLTPPEKYAFSPPFR